VLTANAVNTTDCPSMHYESENRAERIAELARQANYTIYCIGMGNTNATGECGFPVVNPDFLKDLANTTDSQTYDSSQQVGDIAVAENSGQLNEVFQEIAAKILLRLSQ